MKEPELSDPFKERKLQQLQLWFYLLPIVGIFPALWTLYRGHDNREAKAVSRLTITLALGWATFYSLLWLGHSSPSEVISFRLLFLNGLLTSGYFLVSFGLMIQVWQGKKPRLFGLNQLASITRKQDEKERT